MKTVVSLIAKIRAVKGSNEADKGVYNYFFDGEKYGVEEPAGGEGRRYAGPFTLRAQSVLIGNSLITLFGFESAAPSGGELMYLNNPASNIGTENPYLAVVYHKDHLGSTRAITKVDGTILEQNDYYPFGLRTTRGENYTTLSESFAVIAQNANNTTANTVVPEYLYNGKEKQNFIKNTSAVINAGGSTDYTSNYIDYGARFYNPTTLRWNTQDPMAEKYQRYSPYNYCVNNPISLVEDDGLNPRIYIEVSGVGHTFITVGHGENTIVYTYGRYGNVKCQSLGSLSIRGEGVLVRFEGKEAKKYIEKEIEKKGAVVFEFTDADEESIKQYLEELYKLAKEFPEEEKNTLYRKYGRILDVYDLLRNNCTTFSLNSLSFGVTNYLPNEYIPLFLKIELILHLHL